MSEKNQLDLCEELEALKRLVDKGILTQEEFDNRKKLLLSTLPVAEEAASETEEELAAEEVMQVSEEAPIPVSEPKPRNPKLWQIPLALVLVCALVLGGVLAYQWIYLPWSVNKAAYDSAAAVFESGAYLDAAAAFDTLGGFRDSKEQADAARQAYADVMAQAYNDAAALLEAGSFAEAKQAFSDLGDYMDAAKMAKRCDYQQAAAWNLQGKREEALALFDSLGDYRDSKDQARAINETLGDEAAAAEDYATALDFYVKAGSNASQKQAQCNLMIAREYVQQENYRDAVKAYTKAKDADVDADALKKETLECKFQYVSSVEDYTDDVKDILKELYQDPAYKNRVNKIYWQAFAWKVTLEAVNDDPWSTKNMTSVSRYSTVYYHFRVTGGDGGTIRLRARGNLPGCASSTCDSTELKSGDTMTFYYYFYRGNCAGTSNCTVTNAETGEVLCRASATIS